MSTNQIQKVFNYEGADVRTVIIDNEPWFVGKDICAFFGDKNHNRSLSRVDELDRISHPFRTPGGIQKVVCVNESGLYSLLFMMQPQKAHHEGLPDEYPLEIQERINKLKQFKRWVTHEVLPTIRRHGMYLTEKVAHEAIENMELFLSRALLIAKDKIDVLQIQLDDAAPKVLLANSIIASGTSIPVGDMAKILRQHGIEIGQNRLYEWLRDNEYLMKTGKSRNLPTQKAMELELFEIEETAYCYGNTLASINRVARVTGKGQLYFVNLFRKKSA